MTKSNEGTVYTFTEGGGGSPIKATIINGVVSVSDGFTQGIDFLGLPAQSIEDKRRPMQTRSDAA